LHHIEIVQYWSPVESLLGQEVAHAVPEGKHLYSLAHVVLVLAAHAPAPSHVLTVSWLPPAGQDEPHWVPLAG
jgi:hypothetical protein